MTPYSRFAPWLRKIGTAFRMLAGRDSASMRAFFAHQVLKGEGLEIGALDNPMPVRKGVKVRYVDRLDRDGLLRQYPDLKGKNLVPIDIVADGEILEQIGDSSQDFIIANHFLEHCENPIGTLKNFLRVVRPGGVLFLTLPDKRHTFDRDRPETSYDHLLRDHQEGPAGSRKNHFDEWVRLVDKVPEAAREAESARLVAMRYSIHFHVFTGNGALEILGRLRREEEMSFEIAGFLKNADEFCCVLQKTDAKQ